MIRKIHVETFPVGYSWCASWYLGLLRCALACRKSEHLHDRNILTFHLVLSWFCESARRALLYIYGVCPTKDVDIFTCWQSGDIYLFCNHRFARRNVLSGHHRMRQSLYFLFRLVTVQRRRLWLWFRRNFKFRRIQLHFAVCNRRKLSLACLAKVLRALSRGLDFLYWESRRRGILSCVEACLNNTNPDDPTTDCQWHNDICANKNISGWQ